MVGGRWPWEKKTPKTPEVPDITLGQVGTASMGENILHFRKGLAEGVIDTLEPYLHVNLKNLAKNMLEDGARGRYGEFAKYNVNDPHSIYSSIWRSIPWNIFNRFDPITGQYKLKQEQEQIGGGRGEEEDGGERTRILEKQIIENYEKWEDALFTGYGKKRRLNRISASEVANKLYQEQLELEKEWLERNKKNNDEMSKIYNYVKKKQKTKTHFEYHDMPDEPLHLMRKFPRVWLTAYMDAIAEEAESPTQEANKKHVDSINDAKQKEEEEIQEIQIKRKEAQEAAAEKDAKKDAALKKAAEEEEEEEEEVNDGSVNVGYQVRGYEVAPRRSKYGPVVNMAFAGERNRPWGHDGILGEPEQEAELRRLQQGVVVEPATEETATEGVAPEETDQEEEGPKEDTEEENEGEGGKGT